MMINLNTRVLQKPLGISGIWVKGTIRRHYSSHKHINACRVDGGAGTNVKLEDPLQNKETVFAWQKQSVPKKRNNGSVIMSVGQTFWRNRSMSHCFQDTSIFCVL